MIANRVGGSRALIFREPYSQKAVHRQGISRWHTQRIIEDSSALFPLRGKEAIISRDRWQWHLMEVWSTLKSCVLALFKAASAQERT